MEPRLESTPIQEKPFAFLLRPIFLAVIIFLLAGCGGTAQAPSSTAAPVPTTASASDSGASGTGSASPTDTAAASSSSTGQSTPGGQSAGPLVKADGTLKTAMQRVVEADGLRYTLEYTSAQGIPQLDFAFKMEGVASGRLLPNRKVDFTLAMTKGDRGAKQNGEWIFYWDFDQIKSFFKNGGQWQAVDASDLSSDPTNFDPTYAYNELGELTTFGPTDLSGAASPDIISQMAATYTMSGTEQINGEAADRYHLVGEAGGVLDIWVSKATGDIVKFQRDVTNNGMGTIAVLYLSDIGKPETVQAPLK